MGYEPQQQPEKQEDQLSKQRLEEAERERIASEQVDLAEEKRNSVDAKFAKMHEMYQKQMQHPQEMQEANTRMIMQQMAHMQSAMKQSDLLTTTGVEQWVFNR